MSSFRRKQRQPQKKTYPESKINLSQTINTFGIGSMLEIRSQKGQQTRTSSAMVSGLDMWKEEWLETISEPDLCRLLNVSELKAPPSGDKAGYIPARRFPRWLECSSCHRLGVVGQQFDENSNGIPTCSSNNCNGWGVPTRLVSVCFNSESDSVQSNSHIDDFPWIYWAHKHTTNCQEPRLRLESKEKQTGLGGLVVKCHCGASNSLKGALGEKALEKVRCLGNQPWLHGENASCDFHMRGLLRGASNVYFPVTASTISIPPNSSRLLQLLNSTKYQVTTRAYLDGHMNMETLLGILNTSQEFSSFDDEQITRALLALKNNQRGSRTEAERKSEERDALLVNYPLNDYQEESDDEFKLEVIENEKLQEQHLSLPSYIAQISLVHRLREVVAFRGFTRLDSPMTSNKFSIKTAPISNSKPYWLPAIENKGEGVYIELNNETIKEWEASAAVKDRIRILNKNYIRSSQRNALDGDAIEPTARLVMLHTLSHLLIRQLSLECGYSSASLKERIYCTEDYCGLLISTASAASDGTLGGLVRQGKPHHFFRTLVNALRDAEWCSSDPLCIDSEGQGNEALNLAACHACALVSETSCELRNMFLDRGLLIGTQEEPTLGFLSELI